MLLRLLIISILVIIIRTRARAGRASSYLRASWCHLIPFRTARIATLCRHCGPHVAVKMVAPWEIWTLQGHFGAKISNDSGIRDPRLEILRAEIMRTGRTLSHYSEPPKRVGRGWVVSWDPSFAFTLKHQFELLLVSIASVPGWWSCLRRAKLGWSLTTIPLTTRFGGFKLDTARF